MLSSAKIMAFISTTNADSARGFYRDKLGLKMLSEDGFALVFDCGGTHLRVALAQEVTPAKYTVLGWEVKDVRQTVLDLKNAGIACEIFGSFQQDELGIWIAPGGTHIAWFKDPEGNLLSVSSY